jgi:hypothetical protein
MILPSFDKKITPIEYSLSGLFLSDDNITNLASILKKSKKDILASAIKWSKTKLLDDTDSIDSSKYIMLQYTNKKFLDEMKDKCKPKIRTGLFPKMYLDDDAIPHDESSLEDLRSFDAHRNITVYINSKDREGKFNHHQFPVTQRTYTKTRLFEGVEEGLTVHRQLEQTKTYGYNMSNIGHHDD